MSRITATEMAGKARVNLSFFRVILLDENFDWHKRNDRWTVEAGSEEHKAMQRVLNKVLDVHFETLNLSIGMKAQKPTLKQVHAVRCPTCGAGTGKKCELTTGLPRTYPHRDRRLLAIDVSVRARASAE